MLKLSSIPRPVLFTAATIFAVALVTYTGIWLYYAGWQPPIRIGAEGSVQLTPYFEIKNVIPDSSAARAGLVAGDRILAVNGHPHHTISVPPAFARGKPGDVVTLRVRRPGVAEPFDVPVVLEAAPPRQTESTAQWLAIGLINYYPVPFVLVGLLVLFLRIDDRNAWLLALMFAGFVAAAPVAFLEGVLTLEQRRFVLSYTILFYGVLPSVFYLFFATFPTRSPLDRRVPWLKYLLLILGIVVCVPFAAMALVTGSSFTAVRLLHSLGGRWLFNLAAAYEFGCFLLGIASLIWNTVKAPSTNDRRKTLVMVWGTIVGVGPILLTTAIALSQHKTFYQYSFWFSVTPIICLCLLPLSFAYAVVKYRALEIPVLLKRSARYFLVQRGFVALILLAGVAATLLLARALSRYLPEPSHAGVPVGAAFGIILVWGGTQMQSRVTRRLDRAFFRSAYDTRQILVDLAATTRTASSREQLAELLRHEIVDALHPSTLAIYFGQIGGGFVTTSDVPPEILTLPGDLPVLAHMRERGQTWEIVPTPGEAPALAILEPLQPECLVPMMGRDGRLLGLAVLGPKLSEESYSGEDRRLLDSVANQAGSALENIGLAQNMAERLEADRRAAQEMEYSPPSAGEAVASENAATQHA